MKDDAIFEPNNSFNVSLNKKYPAADIIVATDPTIISTIIIKYI